MLFRSIASAQLTVCTYKYVFAVLFVFCIRQLPADILSYSRAYSGLDLSIGFANTIRGSYGMIG